MPRAECAEQLLDVSRRGGSRAESGEGVTTAGECGEQREDECGSTSPLGEAGWPGT
jgi:hypothetical protein